MNSCLSVLYWMPFLVSNEGMDSKKKTKILALPRGQEVLDALYTMRTVTDDEKIKNFSPMKESDPHYHLIVRALKILVE